MSTLNNKVAVVTGGNSGIGLATAKEFIAQGAKVIITGRNQQSLNEAATATGATAIAIDQSNLNDLDKLAAAIQQQFGKIDILFLNAGTAEFSPVAAATEAHFDKVVNANVKGVYFTVQKLLPLLNDGASVIFNASVNASIGMPDSSVYSLSKGAILAFNRVLATELAPRKIRVNAVSPGPVATPLYGKLGLSQEQVAGFSEALGQKLLLGRFGQPEEIAKTVRFLASDDAAFITGTELTIDGGLTVLH